MFECIQKYLKINSNNVTEINDGTFPQCLSLMKHTNPNSAIDIDENPISDSCNLII